MFFFFSVATLKSDTFGPCKCNLFCVQIMYDMSAGTAINIKIFVKRQTLLLNPHWKLRPLHIQARARPAKASAHGQFNATILLPKSGFKTEVETASSIKSWPNTNLKVSFRGLLSVSLSKSQKHQRKLLYYGT